MFSCEFWEISKSTFSYRTPLVAAFAATTTVVLILFVYEVEHFGNGLACNFDLSYFETIVVCNCWNYLQHEYRITFIFLIHFLPLFVLVFNFSFFVFSHGLAISFQSEFEKKWKYQII